MSSTNALTKEIASDIIRWLKTEFDLEDPDEYFLEYYHLKAANKEITVEFNAKPDKAGATESLFIDSGVYGRDSDSPSIEISMDFDARLPVEQHLQGTYFKLLEDIRHEVEHVINDLPGGNRDLSRAEYYIDKGEVPSLVRGLHLRAKKMKMPTSEMFRQELDPYLKNSEINQQECDIIFDAWTNELSTIQGKIQ
jgi:hypothetical protein